MICYREDRQMGNGGGVLTAVHSSIPSLRLDTPPDPTGVGEVLGIKVWLKKTWFTIVNIYLPQGTFNVQWFNTIIQKLDPPFIILGDFNINVNPLAPNHNGSAQHLQNWIASHNLCLLNSTSPTRSGFATNSVIDLTAVSPDIFYDISYSIHPDTFDSDHNPISIKLTGCNPGLCDWILERVHWDRAGKAFNSSLNHHQVLTYEDLHTSSQRAIQENKATTTVKGSKFPPYWDSKCSRLLAQKRKLCRLSKTQLSQALWIKYKRSASELRRYIRRRSRDYWDSVCAAAAKGKSIFDILKHIQKRNLTPQDNLFIHNSHYIVDAQDQCNAFQQKFQIAREPVFLPYDLSGDNPYLDSKPISLHEFNAALKNTKPTSPGEDGVSIKLFKKLTEGNKQKIVDLYNTFLNNNVVPDVWHTSLIIPIKKPGKPSNSINSYRPIALTAVSCKIFERILLHRITNWVVNCNIFDNHHYGFLPFRDSQAAISKFHDDVKTARMGKNFILAVSIDIHAAYDSIWIDGLIYKMAQIGLSGKTGLWIANFLSNRNFRVRWKSTLSRNSRTSVGVPQGSVLSPILFMIYLSDVFDISVPNVKLIVYADDILIYASGKDSQRVRRNLQIALDEISTWCRYWKLQISPEKSSAINLSKRNSGLENIRINGHSIPWSDQIKILGIHFSSNLSLKTHFRYLKDKANKSLNIIKAIAAKKWGANSFYLLKIVNSVVRSLLEYGSPIIAQATITEKKMLEVIYNAALRFATGQPKCTSINVSWPILFSNQSPAPK